MVDDQEQAAGAQGQRGGAQHPAAGQRERGLQVLRRDEVERPGREGGGQVVLFGDDPAVDAGVAGSGPDPFDGDAGDVDGGDLPAVPGQPDGVAAGAAAQIRGGTRGQRPGGLDQQRVGVRVPGAAGAVMLIPEGGFHDPRIATAVTGLQEKLRIRMMTAWTMSSPGSERACVTCARRAAPPSPTWPPRPA
ncbi:hypothetical protein GCM10027610_061870 [Dactylosporangium cerinum]